MVAHGSFGSLTWNLSQKVNWWSSWDFWGAHYKAMIDLSHWSLVIELNLQPLSPSRRAERGKTENFKSLITQLVLLATSPHRWSKSHLTNITKGSFIGLNTQEISRVLGAVKVKTKHKAQCSSKPQDASCLLETIPISKSWALPFGWNLERKGFSVR